MNDTLTQLLTGAVGGAVVSSLIGPYVMQGRERRKARADALTALMQAETARWADKDSTHLTFRRTVGALKAAALVAGVNNDVVDAYARLAATARDTSQTDFDESDDDNPFGGGIPTELAGLTRDAAEALILCIRHPLQGRLEHKKLLRILGLKTAVTKEHLKKRRIPINWNIRDF